jgi:indole-3-glycerol phosphate synthase
MTTQDAGTFLTRILDHKRDEVARQSAKIPLARLEAQIASAPAVRPFDAALRRPGRAALIAEVKKASPSKGVLIENFDPLALAHTYAANGAAAISVLTDVRFFQGSLKFLEGIRLAQDQPSQEPRTKNQEPSAGSQLSALGSHPPLLRKDFIVDPYQVYEARAYGADALLLIVAALEDGPLARLLELTYALGMQALVEVHDEPELDRALAAGARIVGVNNRNLHTFATTLDTTRAVAARLPAHDRPLLVSESGIFTPAHVAQVRAWGADAILVGEALVTAPDTAALVRELAGAE